MNLSTKILVSLNRIFPKPKRPCSRNPNPEALIYPADPVTIEYIDMQIDKGNQLYKNYYSRYVDFDNKVILDIGCGLGGATFSYSKKGSNVVLGLDIKCLALSEGKKYLQEKYGSFELDFICGSATSLPLKSESFDAVVANDFMEHVNDPEKAIRETIRILKEDGFFLFEFAGYYSPRGYHMLYTIYTPWCNVFFSEDTLVKAAKQIAAKENYFWVLHPDWESKYRNGLNKITIKEFLSILMAQKDVKLIKLEFNAFNKFLQPFVYLNKINEVIVSYIFCVLQKSHGSSINRSDIRNQLIEDFKRKFVKFKNKFFVRNRHEK